MCVVHLSYLVQNNLKVNNTCLPRGTHLIEVYTFSFPIKLQQSLKFPDIIESFTLGWIQKGLCPMTAGILILVASSGGRETQQSLSCASLVSKSFTVCLIVL